MDDLRNDQVRTADALTRLAVAAERLGIDHAALPPRLPTARLADGRVSLDLDGRLAISWAAQDDGPDPELPRPAERRLRGLETIPGSSELVELAVAYGRRPFADDVPLLVGQGVAAVVCVQVAATLAAIGGGRCDAISRRTTATDRTWLASVRHTAADVGESPTEELVAMASRLVQLAAAINVPIAQRRLLEQAHTVLGAEGEFTVSLAFEVAHLVPQLSIGYRDVSWQRVVGLTDALRPGPSAGKRLGAFAGAFGADRAAGFELTFVPDDVARVAIAIEPIVPAELA